MKIRCDVCEKQEASVFCTADEAALCHGCDHRVHHANKLANKHPRFPLHHPSTKDSPLCDICQKKRAFLFCKEDRAILCRECDIQIHQTNPHTQKHSRFLLTGVKLSNSVSFHSSCQNSSSSHNSSGCTHETDSRISVSSKKLEPASMFTAGGSRIGQDCSSMPTSSISEYLIETLPGWHVEEFLDPSTYSHPYDFCS